MKTFVLLLALMVSAVGYSADTKTVELGKNVTITVTFSGTGPFTYQWKRNGADLAGANSATYEIPSFTSAHAGIYSVVITNSAGSTRSDDAVILAPALPTKGVTAIVVKDSVL